MDGKSVYKNICTKIFIAALFTKAPNNKQHKCPSMGRWTNTLCDIPAMEYSRLMKGNKLLIHATTWMNLKSLTLSKGSQTQKPTHCVIPLRSSSSATDREKTQRCGCLKRTGGGGEG